MQPLDCVIDDGCWTLFFSRYNKLPIVLCLPSWKWIIRIAFVSVPVHKDSIFWNINLLKSKFKCCLLANCKDGHAQDEFCFILGVFQLPLFLYKRQGRNLSRLQHQYLGQPTCTTKCMTAYNVHGYINIMFMNSFKKVHSPY